MAIKLPDIIHQPACVIDKSGAVIYANELLRTEISRNGAASQPWNLFDEFINKPEINDDQGYSGMLNHVSQQTAYSCSITPCEYDGNKSWLMLLHRTDTPPNLNNEWDKVPVPLLMYNKKGRLVRYNKKASKLMNRLFLGFNDSDDTGSQSLNLLFSYDERNYLLGLQTRTSFCKIIGAEAMEIHVRPEDDYLNISLISLKDQYHFYNLVREYDNRYRSLFINSRTGMFQTTAEGKILNVNQAMADIFGYDSPRQFIEEIKDASQLYTNPKQRDVIRQKLLGDEDVRDLESEVYRRDGSKIIISGSTVAVKDNKGNIRHFQGTITDVTERSLYREQFDLFNKALLEVNDSINMSDLYDITIFVNDAFTKMYGYEKDEVVGKPASKLWGETTLPDGTPFDTTEILRETLKGGWQGELINKKKNGELFPIRLSTSLLHDANGNPKATIAIARDITEEKKAEARLLFEKERAEQANQLKSNILANVSHELRTPLTGIIGFTSIIQDLVGDNEEVNVFLDHIRGGGERLLTTINSILALSDLGTGSVLPKPALYNLREIAADVQKGYEQEIGESGLKSSITGDKEIVVYTDASLISQVLDILIGNAIKFTESGEISMKIGREGKAGVIEVSDTGVGISEEFRKKLFVAFEQESSGFQRKYQGIGVGLNICKEYVKILRGTIEVSSEKGEGTTFKIRIPSDSASFKTGV